jgi:hypothetical protein
MDIDETDKTGEGEAAAGTAAAAAGSEEEADGLTESMLYGEGEGDGKTGDGKTGDGKTGKPKAGEAAGKEADGSEGEAAGDKKPPAKPWDKERQRADQERAAERRSLLDMIGRQQAQMETLLEQVKAAGAPRTAEAKDDLAVLAEEIEALSDESDPSEIVAKMKALVRTVARVRSTSGAGPEVKALQDQIKALQDSLSDLRSDGALAEAQRDRNKAFDAHLAAMDRQYGPQFHDKALAKAREYFEERGYDADHPPGPEAEDLAVRMAYQELAAEAAKKKPGKPGPAADEGRGGGAPAARLVTGTRSEVLADMKRKGLVG